MSPKEIAERLEQILDRDYKYDDLRHLIFQLRDELDPPKPQRPKPGTVVRFVDGDLGIVANRKIFYVDKEGWDTEVSWRDVQECAGFDYKLVHILADDEVAVKRAQIQALLGEVGE